jgi:hypothetical protein
MGRLFRFLGLLLSGDEGPQTQKAGLRHPIATAVRAVEKEKNRVRSSKSKVKGPKSKSAELGACPASGVAFNSVSRRGGARGYDQGDGA